MYFSFVNFTNCEVSEDFLRDSFKKILKNEGKNSSFGVDVVIIGQRKMREINKRYGGLNKVTDILSFPANEVLKDTKKDIQFITPKETENSIGEILLCTSRIKKNAKKFKRSFKKEFIFVFVHGILHLLGYDHKTQHDAKKMQKKEKEIIQALDLLNNNFSLEDKEILNENYKERE